MEKLSDTNPPRAFSLANAEIIDTKKERNIGFFLLITRLFNYLMQMFWNGSFRMQKEMSGHGAVLISYINSYYWALKRSKLT